MSRSPQAISSAAVRRHLEAAGPTVAQVLAAVTTEGAPPVGIQPLVDHVEQTKRWALESGSRHAAWLLYMAARSCLAQIPATFESIEWAGLPIGKAASFREDYEHVAARMSGLGAAPPSMRAEIERMAPSAMAEECLSLAIEIDSDWNWLPFEQAILAYSTGSPGAAQTKLLNLWRVHLEDELEQAVHQNILGFALARGTLQEVADFVHSYRAMRPADRLGAMFSLCLYANQADWAGFEEALEVASALSDDRGAAYWQKFVSLNADDWAVSLGASRESLVERVLGNLK